MNHYYRAGALFRNHDRKGNLLGVNLFIIALENNPGDYKIWLDIGEWLSQLTMQNKKLHTLGMSCLRRAFQLYPKSKLESHTYLNRVSKQEWSRYPIADIEVLSEFKTKITTQHIINEFKDIRSQQDQINLVKHLAQTGDPIFINFLKYCVLNEECFDIRAAVLKRIACFSKQNFHELFSELKINGSIHSNEPFYSIALSKIDEPWAKVMINDTYLNRITHNISITDSEIEKSFNDPETQSLMQSIIMAFDYRKLIGWIKSENIDKINNRFIQNLSDITIYNFQCKNILDLQEKLTPIGLYHINKYYGPIHN